MPKDSDRTELDEIKKQLGWLGREVATLQYIVSASKKRQEEPKAEQKQGIARCLLQGREETFLNTAFEGVAVGCGLALATLIFGFTVCFLGFIVWLFVTSP